MFVGEVPDSDADAAEGREIIEELREPLERHPTLPITARFVSEAGRLGLFLGAGASVMFHMPLVWGLTERLRGALSRERLETMNDRAAEEDPAVWDEVIDEFLDRIQRQDEDYEDWVAWLKRRHEDGPEQHQDAYGRLFTQVVEAATIILTQQHYISPEATEATVDFYRGLGHLAKACRPLTVFSLNHDLCLEMIAAAQDLPVRAGFPETDELGYRPIDGDGELAELAYEKADRDEYPSPTGFLDEGDEGINLLKLHGSIETFAWTDDLDYVRLLPPEETPQGYIELARIINEDLFAQIQGQTIKPWGEVAFNDAQGQVQFLRRTILAGDRTEKEGGGANIPPQTFHAFQTMLGDLGTLLVVGYSFGDEHVNEALQTWLTEEEDRRLAAVAPSATDLELAGFPEPQVLKVDMPATDFFDLIGGNALSPLEQFAKTLRRYPSGQELLAAFNAAPSREQLELEAETLE